MFRKEEVGVSQNSSVFRFDLNETLYFAKDQKVQEMRGIALDPDITVEAFHDYISIRGMLALTGEYKPFDENETEQQVMDDAFFTKRYMERTEEDLAEFSHQFPVEISVPAYRVRNMDDIKVDIETFDYELPEDNHLKLSATIAVQGIINETIEEENDYPVAEEFREEETQPNETNTSEGLNTEDQESFQFEILEKQEEEPNKETNEDIFANEPPNEEIRDIEPADTQLLPEEKEAAVKDVEEMDKQAEQPIPTHVFPSVEVEEKAESKEKEHAVLQKEESKEAVERPDSKKQEPESVPAVEEGDVTEQATETESEVSGNISYLSDLFRDAEEEYTQMRICIVQEQDTVEKISERFGVSAMQIIKQNELEIGSDILEGQLLYIPIK